MLPQIQGRHNSTYYIHCTAHSVCPINSNRYNIYIMGSSLSAVREKVMGYVGVGGPGSGYGNLQSGSGSMSGIPLELITSNGSGGMEHSGAASSQYHYESLDYRIQDNEPYQSRFNTNTNRAVSFFLDCIYSLLRVPKPDWLPNGASMSCWEFYWVFLLLELKKLLICFKNSNWVLCKNV